MDEDTPELITLLVRLGHHIDALDRAKAEVLEDREDALVADVLKDPRDAEADALSAPVISGARCELIAVCLRVSGIVSVNRSGGTGVCRHCEFEREFSSLCVFVS